MKPRYRYIRTERTPWLSWLSHCIGMNEEIYAETLVYLNMETGIYHRVETLVKVPSEEDSDK